MRTSLILSILLLFSVALLAQATRIDATRLVKPSGTASRIYVTNSSGATEWATAAQILTAGSGISISGNTISTTGMIGGSGTAGQVAVFSAATSTTSYSNLLFDVATSALTVSGRVSLTSTSSITAPDIQFGSTTNWPVFYKPNAWTLILGRAGSDFFEFNMDGIGFFRPNTGLYWRSKAPEGTSQFIWRGEDGFGGVASASLQYELPSTGNYDGWLKFQSGRAFGGANPNLYGLVIVGQRDDNQVQEGTLGYPARTNGIMVNVTQANISPNRNKGVIYIGRGDNDLGTARAIYTETGVAFAMADGGVGIGVAATQKLDVNGGTRLRGALLDGLNTAGTAGQVLRSTGSAVQWGATDNIGSTNLTLTSNRTLTFGGFNLTYATAANSFIIDASAATGTLVSPLIVRGKEATPATNALESQDDAGTWRLRLRTTATEARWLTNSRSAYFEGSNYVALNTTSSGENFWYWNANGTAQWAAKSTDPGTINNYSLWANSTEQRFKYKATGASKTLANLEDDVVGTYNLSSSNITLGANLKQEVDANAGAITVTVGSAMAEGITYHFRCRRNGTNTVTLSAEAGYNIAVDGVNSIPGQSSIVLGGSGGSGIQAPFKIYTIVRSGSIIYLY